MASRASFRASDADRDAVVERLRVAAAEGRLETEELEERSDAALRARTYGELDGLLADLPTSTPALRRRRTAQVVPAVQSALAVAVPILVALAVVAAVVVAAAIAAAWWALWALVWFFMCGRGGCYTRRVGAGRSRHRAVSARDGEVARGAERGLLV